MLQSSNSVLARCAKAAVKAALVLSLLAIGPFSLRAHDYCVRILFPFDSAVIRADYMDNAASLATLDSLVKSSGLSSFETLQVVSFSSPEGVWAYNVALSQRRATALSKYIASRYPELAGKVTVNPGGESWNDLRSAIDSDSRISGSDRARMLKIVDSDAAPDAKEASLKAIPSYRQFYFGYVRRFRYAEISFAAAASTTTAKGAPTSAAGAGVAGSASGSAAVSPKVFFDLNKTGVEEGFHANSAALNDIKQLIASTPAEDIESVRIVSSTSPDGTVAVNKRVEAARANALKKYIEAAYPELAGKVKVQTSGENWDGLREIVVSDPAISEAARAKMLGIIDSDQPADTKEARLREMSEFGYLVDNVFPMLRYAGAVVVPVPAQVPAPVAAPAHVAQPAPAGKTEQLAGPEPVAEAESQPEREPVAETVAEPEAQPVPVAESETVAEPEAEPQPVVTKSEEVTKSIESKPVLAVTTNLLYTGATVATGFHSTPFNVGLEIPVGKHWSVYANYLATGPWRAWNNNADCAELIHADLGAKWYPGGSFKRPFSPRADRTVLGGWYAYAAAGAGYYDFENNGKGYQGEELLGTVGLGYGLYFGKHWSLDFALGVGPLYSQYRYYEGRSNNQRLVFQYNGKFNYVGPTDAKITLRYLIYRDKKVKTADR